MKLVVTSRELYYEGKTLFQGDVFEAAPKHATLFKLLKTAAPAANAEPVGEVATTQAADGVEPGAGEAGPLDADAAASPKRGRTYKTRNLTAES